MGRRPQVIVDGQMGLMSRPQPDGCEGLGCEITDCDLRRVSSLEPPSLPPLRSVAREAPVGYMYNVPTH